MRKIKITEKFWDEEESKFVETEVEVPICHNTPMSYEVIPYDDTYGESCNAHIFKCKHCVCQRDSETFNKIPRENWWE